MRTGAIFARGSCRALKWMALFGVVFALGAGQAAAQITADVADEVAESASATVEVTAKVARALNDAAVDLVVTVSIDSSGTNEDTDAVLNPDGVITLAIPAGPTEGDPTEATVTGSVTLQTTQDPDAEDEDVVLAFALTGSATGADGQAVAAPANATITIEDDETQTYVLSHSDDPIEGQAITITVTAEPAHVDDSMSIELYSSDPTYSFATNTITVDGTNSFASQPLTTPTNDGDRDPDEVTVRALSGSLGDVGDAAEPLTITVADIHVLPGDDAITAEATDADGEVVTSVAEGGDPVSLVVTVDRGTGDDAVSPEALTVTLEPANSAQALDYRITPSNEVAIAAGAGVEGKTSSTAITLEALRDEDVGNEALVLNLVTTGDSDNGPGQSIGTFAIDLTDMTVKQIAPKSDADVNAAVDAARMAAEGEDGLNPGESFSVAMNDLFDGSVAGATVAYSASSSDASVGVSTSGTSVMVDAVSAGTATVTVTATVTGVSSAIPQSVSNVAQVAFDVMVDLVPFRVTLPDSIEVMEGGDVELTAMANRAATEDATVTLDLPAGLTGDASITIATGMTSGSAMLTAAEDDNLDDETLTVIAEGDGLEGSKRITVMVMDNDEEDPVEPTVTAKAQDAVDAVFADATGADWMVGGDVAMVDMSMLFDVAEGATIAYAGASSNESVVMTGSSGMTLSLTPGEAGVATITVTASDSASGDVATAWSDVTVALQTLVVTVTASATMVDEGDSVMLTATANRGVTADVTLAVTVTGDTAAVSADESLTIAMNETTGTAMVMAVEDEDTADANVSVVVSGPVLDSPVTFDIAVTDNDRTVNAKSQGEVDAVFTVAIVTAAAGGDWLPGGDAAMVDMSELFMMTAGATLEYSAESSADDMVMASASGSMLTLTPMEAGDATITVMATDTSGDADDTAMAMSMVSVGVLPLEITVMPATADVTEGGTVEITAMANKMVDANTEVMLMRDASSSAGADDYSLAPPLITIMAGDSTGTLTLTATDDSDVEGNERLMLVAMMRDMNIGSVMVSIEDNDMETTYTLSGPMDMNIVEGMSYELTAMANQAVMADTEVMIMRDRGASAAGDDDYTVESIMIMAGETMGTTMLMVTDDGMPDGGTGTNMGEMLVLYGSVDGMEIGTLTFTIWDAAVPALPVIAQLLLAAFLAIGGYRRYLRR